MGKRLRLSESSYCLFSMYSAPIIDIINNLAGENIPIGPAVRAIIVIINIYYIVKHIPKGGLKVALGPIITLAFFVIQALVAGIFFSTSSFQTNINYFMKIMLYLSETILLVFAIKRKMIRVIDFQKFWEFSVVFVPFTIILVNFSGIQAHGRAGFYSSTNAMSIVLMIHIMISAYYANKRPIFWLWVLLNLVGIVLLGTKSPYALIAGAFVAIMLFHSKHRVRLVVFTAIGIAAAYYIIQNYFSAQWNSIFIYQNYAYLLAQESGDYLTYLLSGRNYLFTSFLRYLQSSGLTLLTLLTGISPFGVFEQVGKYTGYSALRGIEMDPVELLFSYGLLVTIYAYSFFAKAFIWKTKEKKDGLYLNLTLLLVVLYSALGGHAVTEAISGTYCAILIAYKFSLSDQEEFAFKKRRKRGR